MRVLVVVCLLAAAVCDSMQGLQQLRKSGKWAEGVSNTECYNMDFLIRLQRTVDYPDVQTITEIGLGEWYLIRIVHLEGKHYVGYHLAKQLPQGTLPVNSRVEPISRVQQVAEGGDLLILRDVLMFLPNADIDYILNTLLPKYKYALIEISVSEKDHADATLGHYRPLKLAFKNGVKVIEKRFMSTLKETWLIRN